MPAPPRTAEPASTPGGEPKAGGGGTKASAATDLPPKAAWGAAGTGRALFAVPAAAPPPAPPPPPPQQKQAVPAVTAAAPAPPPPPPPPPPPLPPPAITRERPPTLAAAAAPVGLVFFTTDATTPEAAAAEGSAAAQLMGSAPREEEEGVEAAAAEVPAGPPPPPPAPSSWAARARLASAAAASAPPPRPPAPAPAPAKHAPSPTPATPAAADPPREAAAPASAPGAAPAAAPLPQPTQLSPADAAAVAPLLDPTLGASSSPASYTLAPRGLTNAGAACYMNAALQALAGSAAWARLLGVASGVGAERLGRLGAPTLAALAELGAAVGVVKGGGEAPAAATAAPPPQPSTPTATAPPQQQLPTTTLLGGRPVDARAILPSLDALKAVGVGGAGRAALAPPPVLHTGKGKRTAAGSQQQPTSGDRPVSRAALAAAPRQEDAQEYLTHLLDAAHCELASLAGRRAGGGGGSAAAVAGAPPEHAGHDEGEEGGEGGGGGSWVTAGRTRRAAAVTRGSGLGPPRAPGASSCPSSTPLTAIRAYFGGLLRSEVRTGGRAPPSATVQPFTVLPLDAGARGVACIPSCLDALARLEPIEGYRVAGGSAGGAVTTTVRATKALTLAHPPPPTLLLHLNRFTYDGRGGGKLATPIAVPASLRLKSGWMSGGGGAPPRYALVGVVAHHGTGLASGHYTASVAQPDGRWLIFDDADVRPARGAPWAGEDGGRDSSGFGGGGGGGDAYLVVYERVDKKK